MKSSVQLGILCSSQNEPRHDKINKMSTPSEDSDQLGQPPSLIGVFSVRMKKPWDLSYPLRAHVGDCKLVSRTIKPKHSQSLCDDNVKAPPTSTFHRGLSYHAYPPILHLLQAQHAQILGGARLLSGRVSDSGARGPGFETYRRRVVSLSKTLYSPKVLVNYPGSDGSVPT